MTQNETVLRHLREHGSLTTLEAMQQYGIMRLSARIHDLRDQGIRIACVMTQSRNRWGEKTTYAKYIIMEGKHEQSNSNGQTDRNT